MDRAAVGDDSARLEAARVRALVDANATALDDVGKSAHESCWVDPCGVWAEEGTEGARHIRAGQRVLAGEQAVVRVGMAERVMRFDGLARVHQPYLRHCQRRPAALVKVRVDAFLGEGRADYIDGVEAGALVAHHLVVAMRLEKSLAAAG